MKKNFGMALVLGLGLGLAVPSHAITAATYLDAMDHGRPDTKAAIEFYMLGILDGISITLTAQPAPVKMICLQGGVSAGDASARVLPHIRELVKEFPKASLPDAAIAGLLLEFPCGPQ